MSESVRTPLAFAVMAALLALVGIGQSWNVALSILNLSLISAIMALGLNVQWGYAGLFNIGVMGFAALGGMAAVLVAEAPVADAWRAGGSGLSLSLLILVATVAILIAVRRISKPGGVRLFATVAIVIAGCLAVRSVYDPAVEAIEAVNPSREGYLGGLGLPILLSWPAGGLIAAAAAWAIGRIALGLRADYLAIATLGIAEIVLAVLRNEDWLTRGGKNVTGLPRPVPYEVDLQRSDAFRDWAAWFGTSTAEASSIAVKLAYAGLFALVLLVLLWLAERALASPWGRMMRAVRDDEVAAEAMGKDVVFRHRQVFVLGSAIIGIAGAMLVTLDGQFTPGGYNPLRFTFLVWVMVIVGGSGNNWGSVLGGFLVWFVWIEAEPLGRWFAATATSLLGDGALGASLMRGAPYMRLVLMGLILLAVLRFSPRGLLPERTRR